MAPRQQLNELLEQITPNVYFQPKPNIEMSYPCIVYNREDLQTTHANNQPYNIEKQYTVTVMDRDPDSEIPDQVAALPKCSFNRFYTADGLNHDVFQLFF
jgi:hypothetical protein